MDEEQSLHCWVIQSRIPMAIKLICTVFFLTILSLPGHALTPTQVFDKVKNSVVVVKTLDAQGKVELLGSGVLLPSGKIATNCHVVEGGVSYRVGWGNRLVSATLYAGDKDKDICILDAKGIKGNPVQLGKATALKVGDPVCAVGAPEGLELSLSYGIVAQLRGGPSPLIQTTAAISHGSSGGGLFDGQGRLVGLTTFALVEGQSLNFAMPAEWIGQIKPGRKQTGKDLSDTEWLKHAIALKATKDWQGLLVWCQRWTKTEPGNAWAWYNLGGGTYDDLDRHEDAIEAYKQAIRVDPEHAIVWTNLGTVYEDLNRHNDAIEAHLQAIKIDPENAKAWYNLGYTYGQLRRFDDAIKAYRQAIKIDPEYSGPWYNLGNAYGQTMRFDNAIGAYQQVIKLDPDHADAWYMLGVTYLFYGNKTAALDAVRELRRLDPTRADEVFNLIVPR